MATQPADRNAEAVPMYIQALNLVHKQNDKTMRRHGVGEISVRLRYNDTKASLYDLLEILGKMEEQGSADAGFAIRDFMNSIQE